MVLGHAHEDHRGAAPDMGVPILCHPDERRDAERELAWNDDRGMDLSKLESPIVRFAIKRLLGVWDGGPVKIADTVSEGDEIAGFKVVPTPGHAPGQISLWRESDRLALVSDTLYTLDPARVTTPYGGPRIPHPAFTPDRDSARDSILRIAALDPTGRLGRPRRPGDGRLQGAARARRGDDVLRWRPRASSRRASRRRGPRASCRPSRRSTRSCASRSAASC